MSPGQFLSDTELTVLSSRKILWTTRRLWVGVLFLVYVPKWGYWVFGSARGMWRFWIFIACLCHVVLPCHVVCHIIFSCNVICQVVLHLSHGIAFVTWYYLVTLFVMWYRLCHMVCHVLFSCHIVCHVVCHVVCWAIIVTPWCSRGLYKGETQEEDSE